MVARDSSTRARPGRAVRLRMSGTSRTRGARFLVLLDVGAACEKYQDETLRNLKSLRIQCDEIWAFVYAKAKNLPEKYKGAVGYGDVWTWTALRCRYEARTILGGRTARRLHRPAFIRDLADRLATRVQLTTTATRSISKLSRVPSARISTTPCSSRLYAGDSGKSARQSVAIARPSLPAIQSSASPAILTPTTSLARLRRARGLTAPRLRRNITPGGRGRSAPPQDEPVPKRAKPPTETHLMWSRASEEATR